MQYPSSKLLTCLCLLCINAVAPSASVQTQASPSQATQVSARQPAGGSASQGSPDKQAASKQTAAWQAQYDKALRQYLAQDYAAAEASAQAALKLAEQGKGNTQPYVASSLNVLAMIRQSRGALEEAIQLFTRAVELSQKSLGNHANTASLHLNLGNAYDAWKKPQDALRHYQRGLAIADGLPGGPAVLDVQQKLLASLGRLHTELGNSTDAERYNSRLLDDAKALPTLVRADTLTRQAQALEQQGKVDDARAALAEALSLQEAELGQRHIAVAQTLAALAALHNRHGQHDQAEPLHRRALAIRQALDANDPGIATHLNELGLWHQERKEYAKAQPLLEDALKLVRANQGADSLEAARILASLAHVRDEQGQDVEARPLYEQALAIYQQHEPSVQAQLGEAHVLNNLAGAVYRKRRFKEAEPLFLRALELTEQAVGPNDARMLPLLDNLQALYRSQGRAAEADTYGSRAAAVRKALEK